MGADCWTRRRLGDRCRPLSPCATNRYRMAGIAHLLDLRVQQRGDLSPLVDDQAAPGFGHRRVVHPSRWLTAYWKTLPVQRQIRGTRLFAWMSRPLWLWTSVAFVGVGLTLVARSTWKTATWNTALLCVMAGVMCAAIAYVQAATTRQGRYVFVYMRRDRTTFEFHVSVGDERGRRGLSRVVAAQLTFDRLLQLVEAGASKLVITSLLLQRNTAAGRDRSDRVHKLAEHLRQTGAVQHVESITLHMDFLKAASVRFATTSPWGDGSLKAMAKRMPRGQFRALQPGVAAELETNLRPERC